MSLRSTMFGCRPANPSDCWLQTIKLKRFRVADHRTQAILGRRPSNSSEFGKQTIKLKRVWVDIRNGVPDPEMGSRTTQIYSGPKKGLAEFVFSSNTNRVKPKSLEFNRLQPKIASVSWSVTQNRLRLTVCNSTLLEFD